jgi:hypothetical protein
MKLVLLIPLGCLLSSCAQTSWVKPGGTDAEFQQHLAEARYNAQVATVGKFNSYSSPFLNSSQQMGESMANGVISAVEQQRLIRMYLEMKGWRLERVPKVAKTNKKAVKQNANPPIDETRLKQLDSAWSSYSKGRTSYLGEES